MEGRTYIPAVQGLRDPDIRIATSEDFAECRVLEEGYFEDLFYRYLRTPATYRKQRAAEGLPDKVLTLSRSMRYTKEFKEHVNSLSFAEEYAAIFGRKPPQGKMFCCFHPNTDTPAAKIYGNVMKCFSCQRTYTTFDLLRVHNPERLNQIASEQLIAVNPLSQPLKKPKSIFPYSFIDPKKGVTLHLLDSIISD